MVLCSQVGICTVNIIHILKRACLCSWYEFHRDDFRSMSHYNYKAYREYKGLACLARRTGEPDEVADDMEARAHYFANLIGLNLPSRTKNQGTEERRGFQRQAKI